LRGEVREICGSDLVANGLEDGQGSVEGEVASWLVWEPVLGGVIGVGERLRGAVGKYSEQNRFGGTFAPAAKAIDSDQGRGGKGNTGGTRTVRRFIAELNPHGSINFLHFTLLDSSRYDSNE